MQIFNRLMKNLSGGPRLSIITILLLTGVLISTSLLPPMKDVMVGITDVMGNETVPVLVVRRYSPESQTYNLRCSSLMLDSIEDLHPQQRENLWMLFDEEDVDTIESVSGIEKVVEALIYSSWASPTSASQYEAQRKISSDHVEVIKKNETNYYEFVEYAAEWDLTVYDYLLRMNNYTNIVLAAVDLGEIEGWNLGFNEVSEGDMVKPGEASTIALSESLTCLYNYSLHDYNIGDEIELLIYPSSHIFKAHLNIDNGSNYRYKYQVTGITPIHKRSSSNDINGVVALEPFLDIIREEIHPDGIQLPFYTHLYVKPTTPMALQLVEEQLSKLDSTFEISRVGEAPIRIVYKAEAAGRRYTALSNLTMILLGLPLLAVSLYDSFRNRKEIWILKARGWNSLDLLSYSLLRSALLGIVAGVFASLTLLTLRGVLVTSLLPQTILNTSPFLAEVITGAISEIPTQRSIMLQPLFGVTAAVLADLGGVFIKLVTNPPTSARLRGKGQ